jgi:GR25 family glycosyltransferase involved in LPS biosynthesis
MEPKITAFEDIKNVFYINLEHRKDRRQKVEEELKKIGIQKPVRFNAFKMLNGSIGCSMSHLKCLQLAKKCDLSHILIVEDDIQFLDPNLFKTLFNSFLSTNPTWDVILFAGNNMGVYEKVNECAAKVNYCQTTTGYLVSSHYYDTLIQNIATGLNNLMRYPKKHLDFAIDQYWKRLQQTDSWFLITPLTVVQREDYSDIEKKRISYIGQMTRLDKLK